MTSSSGERTSSSGARTASSGARTASSGGRTASSGERTSSSGARTASSGERTSSSGARTASSGERTAIVVGAGIFGLATALELARRGRRVTLLDPGPIPHPLAESTDISKVVRSDYGADLLYTELGERAIAGWHRWNELGPARYHETGVAFLTRAPMQSGGFEYESLALLARRGHAIEQLDAAQIAARFPAYRPGALVDGYYHREGGWAEAANVITDLVARARAAGVRTREHCRVVRLVEDGVLVAPPSTLADGGPRASETELDPSPARHHAPAIEPDPSHVEHRASEIEPGPSHVAHRALETRAVPAAPTHVDHRTPTELLCADEIVCCAGAWTPTLIPEIAHAFRTVGQPIFHLRPAHSTLFEAARFPVFGADISQTGYYGFPVASGIVKIANHGPGLAMHPDEPRAVTPAMTVAIEAMTRATFVEPLAIDSARLCVYGDTLDGHFWIDRHPTLPHVTIAAGGSGHAFKFGPVLGALIADAVDDPASIPARFRARAFSEIAHGDSARSR